MNKKDLTKILLTVVVTLILADRIRALPLVSKLPTV